MFTSELHKYFDYKQMAPQERDLLCLTSWIYVHLNTVYSFWTQGSFSKARHISFASENLRLLKDVAGMKLYVVVEALWNKFLKRKLS